MTEQSTSKQSSEAVTDADGGSDTSGGSAPHVEKPLRKDDAAGTRSADLPSEQSRDEVEEAERGDLSAGSDPDGLTHDDNRPGESESLSLQTTETKKTSPAQRAFDRGDFATARHLLEASDAQHELKAALRFDRAALVVILALSTIWVVLFSLNL